MYPILQWVMAKILTNNNLGYNLRYWDILGYDLGY